MDGGTRERTRPSRKTSKCRLLAPRPAGDDSPTLDIPHRTFVAQRPPCGGRGDSRMGVGSGDKFARRDVVGRRETPHPAFRHLLPQGEKACAHDVGIALSTELAVFSPSPLVGEGARRADEGLARKAGRCGGSPLPPFGHLPPQAGEGPVARSCHRLTLALWRDRATAEPLPLAGEGDRRRRWRGEREAGASCTPTLALLRPFGPSGATLPTRGTEKKEPKSQ